MKSAANQYLPQIVANVTGQELQSTLAGPEAKKDQTMLPNLTFTSGDSVFGEVAIASHLARMNPGSGLYGESTFAEAQVNQWISFAESSAVSIGALIDMITKTPKGLAASTYS